MKTAMKTAIKNMTFAQLQAEQVEIDRQHRALRFEQDDLFERRDHLSTLRRDLTGQLGLVGKRLLDIANSAPARDDEVEDLLTQQSDLADRIELILTQERELQREIDESFARENALNRREKHVAKRARELQSEAA
ncbi:MAG: hypothetical protein CML24_09770 [Rhizobiales bacterium]|nr:hypothetical protein [Hyphomicrobiales bacterium]|tara:strand:+ start:6597 stop:7001 length:405 start_codon:yes stop_codon:yes gene_type:complete